MTAGILFAGSRRIGNPTLGAGVTTLWRLRLDGSFDRTFAGGHAARLIWPQRTDPQAAAVDNDGRISLLFRAGFCSRSCLPFHAYVARYFGGTSRARCFGRRATIVGTRHGEKLVGTKRRDVIAALAGNDLVLGRGGNDLICGGRGNDRLRGGRGRDRINGGPGRNRVRQ